MKAETKKLIENYYRAFNAGDMDTFLDLLDENVIHDINQGKREIGKAAFADFMQRMNRNYKEMVTDLVIMVSDDGSRAAAEFVVEGTYLVTDKGLPEARKQKYKSPVGAFFAIKNNKITRVTTYYNIQDWLQQIK